MDIFGRLKLESNCCRLGDLAAVPYRIRIFKSLAPGGAVRLPKPQLHRLLLTPHRLRRPPPSLRIPSPPRHPMPRAPATHRRRGKRPIDGAHRTNSPIHRHRLVGPNRFIAVRSFSLRFALATAPHHRHKRRIDGAPHPTPQPRRRRRSSSRVVPHHSLALRPFFLHYVLASGALPPCRLRKASVIDMGGIFSLPRKSTEYRGLSVFRRRVEGPREVGDLSANTARRGIDDAGDITMEEVPSYKPEEDLHGLFPPLTNEEESQVNSLLCDSGHSKDILVLHKPSNIEITREKLGCLRPRGWLNDEVINLYLELLKERAEREPRRFLKCHFFNTFFYKKLACGKTGYDYQSVRRWTSLKKLGYGLVDCDKIFIPIHRDIHWCLAVINMKEKTYQFLDSLGGMDLDVLGILATYIMDELKDKSNIEIDFSSWQRASDHFPLQHNGWDCGMFMLKFIDFYSRGLGLSFRQVGVIDVFLLSTY
uniref:Uncharacterized protein n=1 Tax=Avena sativa TaxID=4498 RepID=A0ACD5U5U8_AVESA